MQVGDGMGLGENVKMGFLEFSYFININMFIYKNT